LTYWYGRSKETPSVDGTTPITAEAQNEQAVQPPEKASGVNVPSHLEEGNKNIQGAKGHQPTMEDLIRESEEWESRGVPFDHDISDLEER
jgi:hypothetical protein